MSSKSKAALAVTILSFFTWVAVLYFTRIPAPPQKTIAVAKGVALGSETGREERPAEIISYNCETGKNALELLRKKVSDKVEIKTYSFGLLVDSINGLKGGQDNKYWLYYVDGKEASVSADSYRCQGGEAIDWKFTSTTEMP